MKIIKFFAVSCFIFLASCNKGSDTSPSPTGTSSDNTSGVGGSLAKFTINGDYLYTINETSLSVFDISNQSNPQFKNSVNLGVGIETIFPFKNTLFIGSQTGMYIYSIDIPEDPQLLSHYQHVYSCDPVVANDKYAFVTLRSQEQSRCWRGVNQLDIIDISNLRLPNLIKSYPMENPKGLGLDNNTLFVCDKKLKVYDITSVTSINLKSEFTINSFDVIPYNGTLFLVGSDGFTQYQYSEDSIRFLSSIKK